MYTGSPVVYDSRNYLNLCDVKEQKGLLILHLNVRSLINKVELIRQILEDEKIDALCLTESWLTSYISDDLIKVDGYKILRKDRVNELGKRKGGEICIYVKDIYSTELLCTPCSGKDIEMLGFSLEGYKTGVTNCITIYRPPKGNVDIALGRLDQLITTIGPKGLLSLVIHGDFNINYMNKHCAWTKRLCA